jgi:hypothetical protein
MERSLAASQRAISTPWAQRKAGRLRRSRHRAVKEQLQWRSNVKCVACDVAHAKAMRACDLDLLAYARVCAWEQDFMDEEDDPLMGQRLTARSEFDTFGSANRARQAQRTEDALQHVLRAESRVAPVIPGPVLDEFIVPTSMPIGKKLLACMGWREGQGVGPRVKRRARRVGGDASAAVGAARDGVARQQADGAGSVAATAVQASRPRRAAGEVSDDDGGDDDDHPIAAAVSFAPSNARVFEVAIKNNTCGLGFDPLRGAPEFRRKLLALTDGGRGGASASGGAGT